MAKYSPQEKIYATINSVQKIKRITFYALFIVSIVVIVNNIWGHGEWKNIVSDFTALCNIILIVGYAGLSIWSDYFLEPKAAGLGRKDFFDNSFETKYVEGRNSEEYFTNDELKAGFYKMGVNLFENVFFTREITAEMKKRKTLPVIMLLVILLVLAFWGYKNIFIGIPILQLFLSVYFLGSLVKLYQLHNCCDSYFISLQKIFSDMEFKSNPDKCKVEIMKLYVDYETSKAWASVKVDSKLYEKSES